MILLLTRMGSHLYGNSHDDSDKDFYLISSDTHPYRIHKKRSVVKHMDNRYDLTKMDLGTFAMFAYDGVPQALEAMYAPDSAVLVDNIREYRKSFRASIPAMRATYDDVIYRFHGPDKKPKMRFHTLRLATNFREASENDGRFNPVMSEEESRYFKYLAQPENYIEFNRVLNNIFY